MKRVITLALLAFFSYQGLLLLQDTLHPYDHKILNAVTTQPSTEGTFLSETNRYRALDGLAPLSLNMQLHNAAVAKCADMVALDYWSHDTPSGAEPWEFIKAAGYIYRTAGENLAFGQQTQTQVVAEWMESPKHRENLLDPDFTEVGHAVCESPDYQGLGHKYIVVQMLGAK